MKTAVTDAKANLTDLVRRAEAGEEVILTKHGRPVVRLVAIPEKAKKSDLPEIIRSIRASAALKAKKGADAARSQDFLYDENGLPK